MYVESDLDPSIERMALMLLAIVCPYGILSCYNDRSPESRLAWLLYMVAMSVVIALVHLSGCLA